MSVKGFNTDKGVEKYDFHSLDNIPEDIALRCSQFGMTPNDDNGNNFALLCEAISKANRVIVDGFYVLSPEDTYTIDNNISIIGESTNCGFDVSNVSYMFNVGDNCYQLDVDGLTFTNTSDTISILFLKDNYVAPRMNFVRMSGCHVIGSISPIRFYQNVDTNPEEVDIGIDVISITNNVFKDNKSTCFIFSDVSHNLLEVAGNTIRNMGNLFVSSGTTNESTYVNEIANSMEFANIHHNDVYNDDTCFRSDTTTGTYYVFVLIEGNKVHYHHNRVEGMKASSYVALYDAYLSCADVISEYNYWKNNCVFDETCPSNVLMKAKGNGGFVDVGKRQYHNNTYITEKSFYEKFGALENGYVRIVDNVSYNTYDLQGNYFDLYRVEGFTTSSMVKGFTFKNNVFKAEKWKTGSICAGVEGAEIIFDGNYVSFGDTTYSSIFTTGDFFVDRCIVTNNVLRNCKYGLGGGKAKELVFKDNEIFNVISDSNMISSYGRYHKVIGSGNKIEVKNGHLNPFNGFSFEEIDFEIESIIYKGRYDSSILRIGGTEDLGSLNNRIITFEIDGYTVREVKNEYFRGLFSVAIIDGNIKYIKENGDVVVTKIKTDSSYLPLKVNMLCGEKLPFDVTFKGYDESSDYEPFIGYQLQADTKVVFKTHITSSKIGHSHVPAMFSLPDGYTQLDYIKTDGNQCINTERIASNYPDGIRYVFEGSFTEKSKVDGVVSGNDYLFGAYYGGVRVCNAYFAPQNNEIAERRFGIMAGANTKRIACTADYPLIGTDFILDVTCCSNDLDNAVATLNGVALTGETGYSNGVMPSVPIYLFACYGQPLPYYNGINYKFSMYNPADGSLIANFVPAIRDSDDVVGLYETVVGKFHENIGTGSFKTPDSYKGNLTEKDIDYIMDKVFEQIADGNEVAY